MLGMKELYATIEGTNPIDGVKASVRAYVQSFHDRDIEARGALFAEDATFTDPANGPVVTGLDGIMAFWRTLLKMPFKMEPEIHQIVVCGDSALLNFTMHIRGDQGIAHSLHVFDLFQFDPQGRIRSLTAYWDLGCVDQVV